MSRYNTGTYSEWLRDEGRDLVIKTSDLSSEGKIVSRYNTETYSEWWGDEGRDLVIVTSDRGSREGFLASNSVSLFFSSSNFFLL